MEISNAKDIPHGFHHLRQFNVSIFSNQDVHHCDYIKAIETHITVKVSENIFLGILKYFWEQRQSFMIKVRFCTSKYSYLCNTTDLFHIINSGMYFNYFNSLFVISNVLNQPTTLYSTRVL